jgi:hypothetical protein
MPCGISQPPKHRHPGAKGILLAGPVSKDTLYLNALPKVGSSSTGRSNTNSQVSGIGCSSFWRQRNGICLRCYARKKEQTCHQKDTGALATKRTGLVGRCRCSLQTSVTSRMLLQIFDSWAHMLITCQRANFERGIIPSRIPLMLNGRRRSPSSTYTLAATILM